ncbi:MAG TPA: UDP-N-acetylglucosamine 2-epimerase [Hyphomicrobiaceae bacterium]|nr:UDP-N-acetylglucosamine 2-epimerase [Hyphomicrobiaceae bacterium]
MTLTVGLVTSTRAEWGLVRPVATAIREQKGLGLRVLVTGTHLSDAFGRTIDEVRGGGFTVDEEVPILADGDDARAVSATLAAATRGFADVFAVRPPDILLVPGDRYEMLGVAAAALVARVPVAHLFGGDVTEGAFDESIRHAITKMAHVHFVTTEVARQRVCQLGEDPAMVHAVGSPGLDAIRAFVPMDRAAFFARLGMPERPSVALVTFHPPTLDDVDGVAQMQSLLGVLAGLGPEFATIITGSNADTRGRAMSALARDFAADRDGVVYRDSLGHDLYLNALAHARIVIGNSSSGLYEAPSFRIPTVNIGDRQRGRLRAGSVVDCKPDAADIRGAIRTALGLDCSSVVNPYGDGHASGRIAQVLAGLGDPRRLLKKTFHDLGERST